MKQFLKSILFLFNFVITLGVLFTSAVIFEMVNTWLNWNLLLSIPSTLGVLFFTAIVFELVKSFNSGQSVLTKIASESSSNYIFLLNLKNTLNNELKIFWERIENMNNLEISPLNIQEDSKSIHNIAYVVGLYKEVLEEITRIYNENTSWLDKKEVLYEESVFWLSNSYSLAKYQSFIEWEKEDFVSKIKDFNIMLDLWMEKHKEQLEEVEKSIQNMKNEEWLSIEYKNAIDMSQFRFHNYVKQIKNIS